jgi:phenylalanyl-tRNA synthetase beta chain
MKLSLNWIKDYVDVKLSAEKLVERLTMAGLEVEETHAVGKDTVLDIEITPNRPDCLCTIGLARELSAITAKDLKLPKIKARKASKGVSITIENKKDCSKYVGTLIQNVSIGNSPDKINECLASMGIKSINNAVDVTNFVLMEMGQPLHVFDYDKLVGGKIIVRRAKVNETITTLDGIERKLDPSILVIADEKRPVAIAGVMGGLDTGVTADTKNILLESAHFDMGLVRKAARTLGLKSDSSYRFERGIDIEGVVPAADRATDLIMTLANGKFVGRSQSGLTDKTAKRSISITIDDIENLLGTKVSATDVKAALQRLGLSVKPGKANAYKVSVPNFRGDLKQPVDLIEEVARVIGYDNLDVSFPNIQVHNIAPRTRPREVRKTVADVLVSLGYCEAITYSLISRRDLEKTNMGDVPATIVHNALSSEHNLMRSSMLPSMLSVVATNFSRGQKDLQLFEIGKRYLKEGELPTVSIIATGKKAGDWRSNQKGNMDFFDIKGALEQIFAKLGVSVSYERGAHASTDPAVSSKIVFNGHHIGTLGRIDPKVLGQWDIKTKEVFWGSIHLEDLYIKSKPMHKYEPVAEFPAVGRDISIALPLDVSFARIKEACVRLGGNILKNVQLIEEYTGEKIQAGQRGLVLSLTYQSSERTLREDEVNAAHQQILKTLTQDFGATQR